MRYWVLICLLLLLFSAAGLSIGESTVEHKPSLPDMSSGEAKTPPPTSYKNIQLLKRMGEMELARMMAFFTESLGVKCTFCHNAQDYSLDDSPNKKRARDMIKMVQHLNKDHLKQKITCYTCHAGATQPASKPDGFGVVPPLLPAGEKQTVNRVHKNVQMLKYLSDQQFSETMNFFAASTGAVTCFYCHNPSDYSSDELPSKKGARQMITLVRDVNSKFFGHERVTCYTCHHGKLKPVQVPDNWTIGWP